MPYPARLNPHLEDARTHSKAWAREMAMIEGSGIWDEPDLRRARLRAALRATPTPTCDADELALVTDWYVWVFFFDDHFLDIYKRSKDMVGAQGLSRPAVRVHAGRPRRPGTGADQPGRGRPRRPVGADRTGDVAGLAQPLHREHRAPARRARSGSSTTSTRTGSPTRSSTSRCAARSAARPGRPGWSSTPWARRSRRRSRPRRPLRVLRDTFADAVHLRNDLFSYQREVEEEGELSNGVLVLETFLGCTHPGGRRRRSTTCSPPGCSSSSTPRSPNCRRCFAEHGLDPKSVADVLAYVKGPAGLAVGRPRVAPAVQPLHERRRARRARAAPWLLPPAEPGQRAAGSGTALQRQHVQRSDIALRAPPVRAGRPLPLPEFYLPFTVELNPHLDLAREHLVDWARRVGIFDGRPPGLGRTAAARHRPAALRGRDPPRRRRRGVGPDLRLAGLGDLRRRLLPGRLRPHPRPVRRQAVQRAAARAHATRPGPHPAARPTGWSAGCPTCGRAPPDRWTRTRGPPSAPPSR